MEREALVPRPRRRLAGLLLAGTMLAAVPAAAQQANSLTPSALETLAAGAADPSAGATENPDTTDATTTATTPRPALSDEAVAALSDAGDRDGIVERRAERLNQRENSLSGVRNSRLGDPWEPVGVRVGTFVLRPSITQGIGFERTKGGNTTTSRTYSQTGFRGSLTSDWSRHQLTIDAEGVYQRNISGTGETEPEARVNGDLRLDLSDDTVAHITGGYAFERESATDPNAIVGASTQSGVQTLSGGANIMRDFGLIRGTFGANVERHTYGSATATNGSKLDQSFRNYTEGTLTGRVGYELSPALIPYLEASVGRAVYDDKLSAGYERSFSTLGARAGLEIDLGEKLRGDLGAGYKRAKFDDSRLAALEGLTMDGAVNWSPLRGTDLRLGLRTDLEPSSTSGESGYVSYGTTADLTHELRGNLVARLSAAYTLRDFSTAGTANQNIYLVGAGLTWNINRWLAMTGDVSYEVTRQSGASDTGITRAGIGLVLRR
ncbi:outer membrane beta-barrel protein [Shinella zoogloeoides]|uniref:outer membrane beta-barrel protein n=1 Tax=Shinella zoogloeoides TaxID=352475 RepID=UPI000E65C964|nr:outer membrane beta-barrel protein [Shinella zoogloeoides]